MKKEIEEKSATGVDGLVVSIPGGMVEIEITDKYGFGVKRKRRGIEEVRAKIGRRSTKRGDVGIEDGKGALRKKKVD